MEEIRYWQYKWRSSRDDAIQDSYRETFKHDSDRNDELLIKHDAKPQVGTTSLDIKKIIADEVAQIQTKLQETPVSEKQN